MISTSVDPGVRERLALVLDFPTLAAARAALGPVGDYVKTVKVGYELFFAEGPVAVTTFVESGFDVFLDVKLHDIPNTVRNGALAVGRLGARYVTVHTLGGKAMVRAAVEGLARGAGEAGVAAPCALGVTVLTSDASAPLGEVERRMAMGRDGGCGGFVCAGAEVATAARVAPSLVTYIPGIRLPGADANDQGRPTTPDEAIRAGATILGIGRTVTAAADPVAEMQRVHDTVAAALATH
ncbi:MAG TPA: orotidine-5'-phosphate decarboxylase [Acidimicrobiales bacterium]|nr:orotidine-5'-phosphate decarboxylase [Acidimicrobiales bacterium]